MTARLLAALLALCSPLGAIANDEPQHLTVHFFYEPGCSDCDFVRQHILPAAEARYGELIQVVPHDLTIASNRADLLERVARANVSKTEPVYLAVGEGVLLAGIPAIERDLNKAVDRCLSEPRVPNPAGPAPTLPDAARRLASRFTLQEVVVAGLIDSINPCAIAALIFLVSVLTLARERPANILAVGLAYTAGVFVTYTTIGFGLLQAFRGLRNFPAIQKAFDAVLFVLLLIFAAFSFRDAWRARRGQATQMTITLPERFSAMARRTIRGHLGHVLRLSSAFAAGCIVTAIETVCTGQVYAPTLAIVVANGGPASRETALLLLYNGLFVAPLLAVLALAWRGVTLATLLRWSARHAPIAKVAMGGFFLVLAALLLALRAAR